MQFNSIDSIVCSNYVLNFYEGNDSNIIEILHSKKGWPVIADIHVMKVKDISSYSLMTKEDDGNICVYFRLKNSKEIRSITLDYDLKELQDKLLFWLMKS